MSKIALSIYLQPTSCCIGFVNEDGHCLGSENQSLSAITPAGLIELCERLQVKFQVVTFHHIGLVAATNVSVSDELLNSLESHFQAPVNVSRAGLALANYEHKWGYTIEENNFVAIAFHDSIDGGIFLNGKQAVGDQGLAGGLNHLLVHENGEVNTMESYFSAEGIKNMTLKVMAIEDIDSPLRLISVTDITPTVIINAATNQDKLALEVIKQLGEILGLKLSDMVNYFSPKYFVLSTYSKQFSDLLIQAAAPRMEEAMFPVFKGKVEVITSKSQGKHSLALQAGATAF